MSSQRRDEEKIIRVLEEDVFPKCHVSNGCFRLFALHTVMLAGNILSVEDLPWVFLHCASYSTLEQTIHTSYHEQPPFTDT